MVNQTIDKPNCYAKCLGGRAWITFKTKGTAWRGLALDFQQATRNFAPYSVVRDKVTGQRWVDASAVRKRRGSGPRNLEEIG